MTTKPYSALLMLLVLGLVTWVSTSAYTQAAEPQPGEAEPWVGQYTVFSEWCGALLTYRGDGPVTISRDGEGYRISREPETLFIEQDGSLVPQDQTDSIRIIGSGGRLGPGSLSLAESFQMMHLAKGVGPAADPLLQDADNAGQWAYRRGVLNEHQFNQCLHGELTLHASGRDGPEPVGYQIPLGSIIITPVGKFMYFGQAEDTTRNLPRPCTGWLNTLTYGRAVFNDDGSLTEIGHAYREALQEEQRALNAAHNARVTLESMVTQEQVDRFTAAVQPGMTLGPVLHLLSAHFNVLDREGETTGEGTYTTAFSVRHAGVTLTLHFVRDAQTQRWVVPGEGVEAVTVQWNREPAEASE